MHVFELLKQQILSFERKPHEPMSEGGLAEQLSVSRTPVREALARLSALQLVDIKPQRGTFVAPIRVRDLKRAQFLRESLEVGLIRRAMNMPDQETLRRTLSAELTVQRAMAEIGDLRRFSESDELFHRIIASTAGLPEIWDTIAQVKIHINRAGNLMLRSEETMPAVMQQHVEILESIASGDPAEAERVLKSHLRRVISFVHGAYSTHGEYFEGTAAEYADPSFGAFD